MRVTATFSDAATTRLLAGRAIGDEFEIFGTARIVGADEVLVDITPYGDEDRTLIAGELEVRLLVSHVREVDG